MRSEFAIFRPLRWERSRSERVTGSAMDFVGPVVARNAGVPSSVWLVGRTRVAEVGQATPASIGIERSDCGCLVEIPVVLDQPMATWGIECEHSLAVSSQ
jgi:hypothetical protein